MNIDFGKLFNPRKEQIKTDTTEIDEIFKHIYKITRNLTKSSEMFKKRLQEIINSLNKFNSIQFTVITNDKYKMKLEKLYVNKSNEKKIVYFPNMYTNNKGEEYYEQYKSKNSIVG